MSNIMVFIPAYRCENQIGRVLAQFTPSVAQRFAEIVVVENRSPDGTLEAARQGLAAVSGCPATLLRNEENYSLGGSHKVAFNYCLTRGYDYLVVLHGDDQGHVNDLLPLLADRTHEKYDCLLGARFMRDSRLMGYSAFRTWGNIVLNQLISLGVHTKVYDMGAGLNLYKSSFLASRFYLGFPDDLTFNVYMLLYAIWVKSPFLFFPLTWREDDQISNARIFRQAWRILGLTGRYRLSASRLFARAGAPKPYKSTVIAGFGV